MTAESASYISLLADVRAYLEFQKEMYGNEIYIDTASMEPPSTDQIIQSLDLAQLHVFASKCQACPLHKGRRNVVFGKGDPAADIMIVGEGPGVDEDKQGEPFVGAAGQLLTKILAAIQLTREDVYIANIVKCHPANNRDPQPNEKTACRPYLDRQIALIRPKFILALGKVAGQALTKSEQPMHALRGKTYDYENAKVIVTYHPAALLRHSEWKRDTWEDVQMLQRLYNEIS